MAIRVLVTGAAGFIGSHVAERCIKQGMSVVATDDLSGGRLENVPRDAVWVQGDLRSKEFVEELWKKGPFDYVYHLAAYAAEGLSHHIRKYNYEVNLVASIHLINQAVKNNVKCFVFTSSIAVYGKNQLPMSETLTPLPEDPYGISKYAVELDLRAAQHYFGLNWIVFRPHNVYGERQNIADKYRNVTNIFINQALQGQEMTIFGDGLQTRAFSHVDDVAPLIAKAPLVREAYNQIINIGADTPVTVLELSKLISKTLKLPHRVRHLPARKEVVHAFANHARVQEIFNPPAALPLEEGLKRVVNWVKKIGPVSPTPLQIIEIERDLPSVWLEGNPIKKAA